MDMSQFLALQPPLEWAYDDNVTSARDDAMEDATDDDDEEDQEKDDI